ncbi:ribonuclease H-like domain-containing protein [Tanacetum coccineum]
MVPRTVLTRSGPISLNTARPVNIVQPRTAVNNAGLMKNVINNAYSTARRPFNKITATNNNNFTKKVNTVKETRVNTAKPKAVLSAVKGNKGNVVKASACWGNPQQDLKNKGVIDSGCSRHMTGNRSYLTDYEEIDGGFVAFGGNSKGEKITGKGKIRTGKLDFEDVYFVKELKFNLFSVSQMCDKKNSVLFTDTECVLLSPDFKLTDESHVLLKVPRKDNMYSIDLKNVVPQGGLTCLFAKATPDESNLWHRRLGHVNFKTMNKLVRGNLVRGLPSKLFEINQTYIACQKGKQHRASCKTEIVSSISQPLQMLHMDLFGPTFVKSLMKKMYRLVVTDDFSRKHALSFMRPFGCPVTILNTIDHLGKFDRKANEGFFVRYSTNSKAFRVFNSKTRIVEENPHVQFSENTPNIVGSRPNWIFDIDALTKSMNYKPVVTGNQSNGNAGTKAYDDAGKARVETIPGNDYILLPLWTQDLPFSSSSKDSFDDGFKPSEEEEKKDAEVPVNEREALGKDSEVPINAVDPKTSIELPNDPNMPKLEDIVYSDDDEDVGTEADMNNLDAFMLISPIATTRIHKDHLVEQIIRDLHSAPQTRRMKKNLEEHEEPKKKDERGIMIKNKARLFTQGYTQEEGIDYDDVFAPVARIEAIRLFLAYALFKDFLVYQMDVKNAFLYGKIEEEVYVCQPLGFEDLNFPDKVYKVEKALYGLYQAPKAWSLKFGFTDVKTTSTPMETYKPLLKDADGEDVDEHLYRSMIGSLMYLTSLRPDIMFAVCACARYQINPKVSHLYAVKKIFRYLKGQPKLGLWYPKDSPFYLVAYTDSDYAGASLDKKSTTGGCQFLGCRLISWQCKKQTVVANSTTKAEYIAASNCCGQSLLMEECLEWNEKAAKDKIENADFAEIVDFLNANPISVCLTTNQSSQPKKTHRPRKTNRATKIFQSSGPISLVADETVTKEREDRMERAATTASSLEAEQDSGNINRTQSMATLNEPSPQGTGSGSGPRCQDTILGGEVQTRFETASKQSNDPPLSRVNTLGSGEDRLKLNELMELCTKLSARVLDLETTKTAQAKEIANLKKRVKKLERKKKSRILGMNLFKIGTSRRKSLGKEDASKQGRNLKQRTIFEESNFDEEFDANMNEAFEQVFKANKDVEGDAEQVISAAADEVPTDMEVTTADIDVNTASASVTTTAVSVSTAELVTTVSAPITTAGISDTTAEPSTPPPTTTTVFEDEDIIIAQTLVKMRSEKSKERGVVMQEPSETPTRPTVPPQQLDPKDKGKGKMVEPEKLLKRKDQIKFDEDLAQKLQAQMQAELEEEEKLAKQREEDKNIVEWDNVQAMMDADYELTARLQE